MKQLLRAVAARQAVTAGCIAAFIAGCCGGFNASPYDNYVLLAQAFLRGQVTIPQPAAGIDALLYHGAYYIIEAPAPALFLLPFVARYGIATNQSLLGVALCGVAVAAAWNMAENMRAAFATRIAVVALLFAGTDLFWCASLGDVWFLAHVSAVAMTMLALRELSAERRPALVALWGCLAAESRFSMVLALPVYFIMLVWPVSFISLRRAVHLSGAGLRWRCRRVAPPFVLVTGLFLAAWVMYNMLRWGIPSDIGYTMWYRQDSAGSPNGSPFALRYLPYELQSFFWTFPPLQPTFPWVIAPIGGLALEVTSPALMITAFARDNRPLVLAMWLAALLTAAPSFIYYVDGYAQFGMRHALDFEPFLAVLATLAMRSRVRVWQGTLCAYSVIAGTWGVWYWHVVLGR